VPSARLKDILEPSVDEKFFYKEGTKFTLKDDLEPITVPKINVIGHVDDIKGYDLMKRIYDVEGLSPTLNTMKGGNRQPKIIDNGRVRKLTPLECFRLQGFEDSVYETLRAAGISNTQLYSLSGNAVSVPVVREIIKKLKPFII
jgi:DNA (cytosine-5)-methyltransferase 1